ncbi:fimbria/pilus outer membrane usher protein [Variovorax boronicumulans]|uniref:fimbria/pilus outer membrane usher protein n=1 Tax=Variovorax boronicumulans TaxID=436515 RepID=UPI00132FEF12|nr:fimbria/pilus outer membrane usher protein [Variovorax boronicumulans]
MSFRTAAPAAAHRPRGRAPGRVHRRSPVAAAAVGGRTKGASVGLPAALCVLLVSPSAFALAGEERADALEQFIKEKQVAGFDLDVLRQRGIDPKLADYFRHEARFRVGTSVVTLFVNGERRGLVPATFDAEGRLCFDETLRDKAGLVTGSETGADDAAAGATACDEFQRQFPSTIVELRPGRDEVRLIVPTDAFRARERADTFSSGGVAGLLNYDLLTMDSRHAGGTSSFHSLGTEAGLNVGDWIFRSRQSYTSNNGKEKLQHLYAYGQKTLTGLGATVQGGQITIASSIFPGDPILGVQIVPEEALRADARDNGAVVEGIAHTQARVEVRQNHALIYSTVVPPGPFSLTGLPLLSGASDLEVTVIEADGSRRPFTVPAAALGATALRTTAGYSFAVGRYRPYGHGDRQDKPWVATGTGTWALDKRTHLTAGAMAASRYQAAAWAVNRMVVPGTMAGFRQAVSNAAGEGVRGTQVNASVSSVISPALSASMSATQQTRGFRDLADTVNPDLFDTRWTRQRYKGQYTGSVGWTHASLGGFRLAYSASSSFDGRHIQRVIGSWVKSFPHATVSLNVERSTGDLGRFDNRHAAYVTVSIPLGSKTVKTYVNRYDDRTRAGVTLNERIDDTTSYQVSAERDSRDGRNDFAGRLSLLPRYTQVNVGFSRNGSSTTYSGQLQGGIVAHKDGITFSPYPVQDTFGIVSVGGVSGVRIGTPQGPVWTDAWGRAVAPQLFPYHTSRLEIATRSLPRNVDLVNGYQELDAGRGSVNHIRFGVVNARRVLLKAVGPAGQALEKGGAVVDNDNQYVTSVVDGGQVFLPDVRDGADLRVTLSNGGSCRLAFSLPEKPDASAYFESADATCTAMEAHQ